MISSTFKKNKVFFISKKEMCYNNIKTNKQNVSITTNHYK